MKKFILIVTLISQTLSAQAMADSNPELLLFCHFRTAMGMAFLEVYSQGSHQSVELGLLGKSLMPPQALLKTSNNTRFKKFISESVYLKLDKNTVAEAPMGNTEVSGRLSLDLPDLAINNQKVKCEIKR